MADYIDGSFDYAGRKYTLAIVLVTETAGNIVLDTKYVVELEYSNGFNQLAMTGSITYVDTRGEIDRLLESNYAKCEVTLKCSEVKSDNGTTIETYHTGESLDHVFLVNKVEILDRMAHEIKYKISLISINIVKLLEHFNLSTYGIAENRKGSIIKEIFDILMFLGLKIDNSFSTYYTKERGDKDVSCDYIATINDTALDTIYILLNKLYYYSTKQTDSMKFVFYDDYYNTYKLFDTSYAIGTFGSSEIVLSMSKTPLENMITNIPTNLGVISKTTTLDNMKSTFKKTMTDYSYDNNTFADTTFEQQSMVNLLNVKDARMGLDKKFKFFKQDDYYAHDYTIYDSSWNNRRLYYKFMMDTLLESNSLILNVDGNLNRRVGVTAVVMIDNGDTSTIPVSDKDELNDIKNRYVSLSGVWFVHRVRNIISPNKQTFRQNVCLFRNFNPKRST